MNETSSLLLATVVLALGGLGLYVYKNSDDDNNGNKNDGGSYDEDVIFDSNDDYIQDVDVDIDEKKSKVRSGKTKRRKNTTGSKRRY